MKQTPSLRQVDGDFQHGYGYCQCGCGRRTKLLYNGEYSQYLSARHHPQYKTRAERQREAEVEKRRLTSYVLLSRGTLGERMVGYEMGWGFCQCGCGEKTSINRDKAARFVA